jgi:nucleoside-diphosphate-sugar epimerase
VTNVLLTGCTGFVGSNLCRRLVDEGYNVYGLVRHASKRDLEPLNSVLDRIHLLEGDLTQYHSVASAIKVSQAQFILHLGALTPVRLSFEDPFAFASTNFYGTMNIVHALIDRRPKARLVYASTAEVYGWQKSQKPIKETEPMNPASPYAVAKAAADQYVRMATRIYDLQSTIMRPINTYGRRGERGYLVEYLISSMLKGETCYVGAPGSVRDYMFKVDHLNAYLMSIKSEKAIGRVFNVSPGNPLTNKELAESLASLIGYRGRIICGSYPPGYAQRPLEWDPSYLVLDNSAITRTLGWKATVSLKEGLAKTIESWRRSP